jgi:hypothetical protein
MWTPRTVVVDLPTRAGLAPQLRRGDKQCATCRRRWSANAFEVEPPLVSSTGLWIVSPPSRFCLDCRTTLRLATRADATDPSVSSRPHATRAPGTCSARTARLRVVAVLACALRSRTATTAVRSSSATAGAASCAALSSTRTRSRSTTSARSPRAVRTRPTTSASRVSRATARAACETAGRFGCGACKRPRGAPRSGDGGAGRDKSIAREGPAGTIR